MGRTEILNKSTEKPLVWKRYMRFLCIEDIYAFTEQANTDIAQPINSRLKYQTKKSFSWTLAFTKATDLEIYRGKRP